MTALDGEHDPLLTALRSARFDSLQDTTLLGFSPSEHSAAGNAICCISVFEKVFIIDRWCWVGKMQLTWLNWRGNDGDMVMRRNSMRRRTRGHPALSSSPLSNF